MDEISFEDVTTIMTLLSNIDANVTEIRRTLEDDDGEEEAPEDDA